MSAKLNGHDPRYVFKDQSENSHGRIKPAFATTIKVPRQDACVKGVEVMLQLWHIRAASGGGVHSITHRIVMCDGLRRAKQKAPRLLTGGFFNSSLTMTYFHTGTRTIIGAESFHCPVRDGKEWDQLAMVIRQKGLSCWG